MFGDSPSVTAAVVLSIAALLATPSAHAGLDDERSARVDTTNEAGNVAIDRATPATSHSDPGIERHDGFYLRISGSFGLLGTHSWLEAASAQDVGFDTLVCDVMSGGTPLPGFTVGGALRLEHGFGADAARRDDRTTLGLIGPFVDVFPSSRGGFHLGGMIGAAGLAYDVADSAPATYGGAGASLWLGYDVWIAQQWSSGVMLTGSTARLTRTDGMAAEDARIDSVSVLLGWLYH